ncbi:MAG TPA: ABC transporter permease [Saprospiraceae bacterium]|nr:ABC transporter permease [Saprospiraceae bacterium]HMP23560.1 ABC transporter permease [Saprospiraceae bacterium]
MNLLQLSWKNLTNKPLSMLLSLVLFALGVGLISLLLLLSQQLQEKFDKNLAGVDLVIGAKGSPLQLILCNMYHIDAPTGNVPISAARPFLNPNHPLIKTAVPVSVGDNYKGYRIVGTDYRILDLYEASIGEGALWEKTFEVTIGAGVAADLKLSVGDKFFSSHGFIMDDDLAHDDADPFVVTGILAPTGAVIDQLILTNTQSIWAVHDHEASDDADDEAHEHDHYAYGDVHTSLLEFPDQDITALLVQFKMRNFQTLNMQRSINENTDLQAATPAIEINRLYSMMGLGEDALRALALVIIFVSGLSVFISLYSSLKERKYELALMRVMGSSPGKIFLLIVLEGLLLALIGYIIGMVLSHGSMEILAGFMKSSYRYSFSGAVFLREELYLLAAALGIGFIAAVIPAIQARNADISATLAEA